MILDFYRSLTVGNTESLIRTSLSMDLNFASLLGKTPIIIVTSSGAKLGEVKVILFILGELIVILSKEIVVVLSEVKVIVVLVLDLSHLS